MGQGILQRIHGRLEDKQLRDIRGEGKNSLANDGPQTSAQHLKINFTTTLLRPYKWRQVYTQNLRRLKEKRTDEKPKNAAKKKTKEALSNPRGGIVDEED